MLYNIIVFIAILNAVAAARLDPDVGLNVTEIIKARGYHVETHKTVTLDGYILTSYRIPLSFNESKSLTKKDDVQARNDKPAVLLMHGLLDSSFTWVNNNRFQSFAFILADAGYDVWLGNNRGTTWSKEHIRSDRTHYWDFSWEQMALYDAPALIEYVKTVSKKQKIAYIGHSEGNMQAFAAFSLNQTLARDSISYFAAVAPVAYVKNMNSIIFKILLKLKWLLSFFNKQFFPTSTFVTDKIGVYGCNTFPNMCDSILGLFNGMAHNVNVTRIPVYLAQTPAGTSVKNIKHFIQGARPDGGFRRYDYGCDRDTRWLFCYFRKCSCANERYYGRPDPPSFNLSNIQFPPMGLYTGGADALATVADVEQLTQELVNATIIENVHVKSFNHLDFTWATNARESVYDPIITILDRFNTVL